MRLKKLIHQVFRKTGFDFCRYTSEYFPMLRRIQIITSEMINLVIDVGANEGDYARGLRDSGYRYKIISFEPQLKSFNVLKQKASGDTKWTCVNAALGMSVHEGEMCISGHKTSSSFLPITETHLHAMPMSGMVGKENVKVLALDSLLGDKIVSSDRIYLKIDVQGYERFVLQGSIQVLAQVRAIELELSLVPLYEESPLMNEMINYLETHGFILVALNHVFSDPNSDRLLQIDGIFKKKQCSTGSCT